MDPDWLTLSEHLQTEHGQVQDNFQAKKIY